MRAISVVGGVALLAVMMLVPATARAQSQAFPEYEGVGEEVYESSSSPLPLTAREGGGLERDTSLTSVHVPRFVLASLGGAAGGALLGTAGFYAAGLAMCMGSSDGFCLLGAMVIGGGLGAAAGIVGGTLLIGHLMDGDGAWWGVLGGVMVGAGLGITAANFVPNQHTGAVFGATMVGTVLLGALGYELTSHRSAKFFRDNRYALAPTLIPGARGAMAPGLAFSGTWN